MISLIVAYSKNRVIGRRGALPWHQKADLAHFKNMTRGHGVVMGLRTFESIGRPLPARDNYVLTHNPSYRADGVTVLHALEDITRIPGDVFVIGGGVVYAQALPLADRLCVTEIHTVVDDGDAFFPPLDASEWREVSREAHMADADNQFDYDFVEYRRHK